jgi:hypothetical protein
MSITSIYSICLVCPLNGDNSDGEGTHISHFCLLSARSACRWPERRYGCRCVGHNFILVTNDVSELEVVRFMYEHSRLSSKVELPVIRTCSVELGFNHENFLIRV